MNYESREMGTEFGGLAKAKTVAGGFKLLEERNFSNVESVTNLKIGFVINYIR